MSNSIELDEIKQEIATLFGGKTNYDDNEFNQLSARYLIEYSPLQKGQKILDIATGTGLVAIEAAQIVGSEGQVIGIDISSGMLNQAKQKIAALGLSNIEMIMADTEVVKYPKNSFDGIFCCAALQFINNVPELLCRWYSFLVPGGFIGLCVFAETSFIAWHTLENVTKQYGVELGLISWYRLTGTEKKCHNLLTEAGFEAVGVRSKQVGNYLSLNQAKKQWQVALKDPRFRPLRELEVKQLELVKEDYCATLETLVTDKGIWNDIQTLFVFGRRPV